MTASYWSKNFSKTHDTDVIIVGAGFAGLSTAFWLTEFQPHLRITILDRSSPGAGASGRNAGFLTKGSFSFYRSLSQRWGDNKALEIFKYAASSIQDVHDYILKKKSDLSFEVSQSLTLLERVEGLKGEGNNFAWVKQEKLPAKLQDKYLGGYQSGPEYKINPRELLMHMQDMLVSRKVRFQNDLSAFKLTDQGVLTEDCLVRGRKVILALNGYFPQFHSAFKKLITPRRAQMLAVELREPLNCPDLYYHPDERVYWRMLKDNILIVGGKRLVDAEGETGDFEKLSPIIQNALEAFLADYLKLEFQVVHRWSGIMGFTEDELPFVTRVNAPIDTFALGGFSGHGMGLGFRSGKEMAQLVTEDMKESFFSKIKSVRIDL